jgi:hypothetical protein
MIENIEIILSAVATTIGFLTSTVFYIIKYIKAAKSKQNSEHHIEIRDVLLGFIIEAEKFASLTGEQKKQYVMDKIRDFAATNNLTYNVDGVSKKIDEIVALAKVVNIK